MRHDDDIRILGLQGKARSDEYMGYDHEEILGAEEILGLVESQMQKNPAFANAVAQRVARTTPVVKTVAPTKKRRWPLGLTGSGAAGTTVNISVQPQCLFRGEKLIATDTDTVLGAGFGTQIVGIFVGNKPQLPTLQNNIPTSAFAAGALDNEMLFDTCDPAIFITFQVSFINACTWNAALWGHAVQN